jgi:flagellar biosynthesis protein FlhF
MEQIKTELGRDALILSQRTLRKKRLFSKPLVEVVAAYETAPEPAPAAKNPLPQLRTIRHGAYQPMPPAKKQPPSRDAELSVSADRALEVLEKLSSGAFLEPEAKPPKAVRIPDDDGFRPIFTPANTEKTVNRQDVPPPTLTALENKLDALSSSVSTLAGSLRQSHDPRTYSPEVEALLMSLLENETHEEFAHKLAREVSDIVKKQQADPNEVMEQLLRQYIGQAEPIRLKRFKRTVVLLVGSTGVGKTTTLAKLSAIYSINHHAKVGVITTDTYRIAAVEQLKVYTQILEVPLSVVYAPEEIEDALKEHEDKDIVFVDTAGKSPTDRTHEEEIKNLIRYSDCDEVHLVLSATTSFTGLLNILNAYSFLNDYKLIVTKLDETPTWGALLNARFLSDRPISYTAIGQNVPDDIEVADVRKIVARLMTRDP